MDFVTITGILDQFFNSFIAFILLSDNDNNSIGRRSRLIPGGPFITMFFSAYLQNCIATVLKLDIDQHNIFSLDKCCLKF